MRDSSAVECDAMEPMRLWSARRWFFVLTALVVIVVALVVGVQVIRDRTWWQAIRTGAPVGAVLVGLLSLVVTAVSLTANWRRQRREATLRAWSEWSDKTIGARQRITRTVGMKAMPAELAQALVDDVSYSSGDVDLTSEESRRKLLKDMVVVLNGLERLAVGVEAGVFDLVTLRRVGGTIILRHWDRAETYIDARRTAHAETKRQAKVYLRLQQMALDLQRHDLSDNKDEVDRKRLEVLRRNRR